MSQPSPQTPVIDALRRSRHLVRTRWWPIFGILLLAALLAGLIAGIIGLPFSLLADEDHAVAEQYGTWVQKENYGKTYFGVQRATFLIDPEGRIARVWPKVKPDGHADEFGFTLNGGRAGRITVNRTAGRALEGRHERGRV